jgi:hypothetical protein
MNTSPENPDAPPVRPQEPAEGDCCHSGCMYCVMDMYEEELHAYQQALKAWQEKNPQ